MCAHVFMCHDTHVEVSDSFQELVLSIHHVKPMS